MSSNSMFCGFIFILICSLLNFSSSASLKVGFYKYSCPSAEASVRKTVKEHLSINPGLGAGLVRMHFHDCFVRGCDASVLLHSTPGNPSELEHIANNPSLRGFEVIDKAKSRIEAICPETVSCADILAFAARDSAYRLGGINYAVPAGRRDGIISKMDEVAPNLPRPTSNATKLAESFARKGLATDEMVTLSGGHSIGISRCSQFSDRLYSFNATHAQDPSLDPEYAAFLKTKCPPPNTNTTYGVVTDPTVGLDPATPNRLDNSYYYQLKNDRGLLISDQTLMRSPFTRKIVEKNAMSNKKWTAKFAKAMVRMGSVDVLTGTQGEIRTTCSVVNYS